MADDTSRTARKDLRKPAPEAGRGAKGGRGAGDASDPAAASRQIDAKIAELADWRGERLAELRAVIHAAVPEVVEGWKWMGSPTWSHAGLLAVANAHKDKVKITFSQGAHLPDPQGLFNAGLGGNQWRAIDLKQDDRLDRPAFQAMLREAVAFNLARAETKTVRTSPRKAGETRGPAAPAAGPELLSGGNPRIPKGDGDAPVQAYLAAMPGWKQDVGRRLDALIEAAVPDVRKAVKWNSPFYGVEGQGWFLSFHCFTRYVKVTFFRGAALTPPPPETSKQPDVRSLHVYEDGALDEDRFDGWIRQAAARPGWQP